MPNQERPQPQQGLSKAVALISDWVTVEAFCQQLPNIPEKTLRWQLTTRHKNGLAPHVQVIGKQRFISVSGYADWLSKQAEFKGGNSH